jgi:hypothetical protein
MYFNGNLKYNKLYKINVSKTFMFEKIIFEN